MIADGDVLEELDFQPACDWKGCESRGVWVATWPCCKHLLLVCAEHQRRWSELLKEQRLNHKRCGSVVGHMRFEPLPKGGA